MFNQFCTHIFIFVLSSLG